ncbi:MAG: phosphate transport system regulatory protein PhoU, partial [Thermoplasmata archaeon]|nr:phosphate transport system regulatory protein PhoU [Thermoplasmata archaeon]
MIRTKFEEGLKALKNSIVEMEQEVKKQLQLAVEAFISQDIEKGRVTIEMDEVIDRMEDEIEKKCIDLLALQQPIASDLRFVSSSMKIITDLERIGDYATDIAKILEFVHE